MSNFDLSEPTAGGPALTPDDMERLYPEAVSDTMLKLAYFAFQHGDVPSRVAINPRHIPWIAGSLMVEAWLHIAMEAQR